MQSDRSHRLGRNRFFVRRRFLSLVSAATGVALFAPLPAFALSQDEATSHVRATIEEVVSLVSGPGDSTAKAPQLLQIIERRAAMPQIARFAAGTAWRSMNEDQQNRYTAAFAKFMSFTYAGRFGQYSGTSNSGKQFDIVGVLDAGKKGIVIKSTIYQTGGPPVAVDWLVSDRPGRTVVADIVIEGISMLVTERENIAGMLEARGGDVEKLINDLGA